jgi:hypothetical protein
MNDDDDAEIIPPSKGLPAKRRETTPASMSDVRRLDTGGIVGSTITRWKAGSQSRALDEIAKRYRSEADAIKAYGEVADAFEDTARKVNRLRHLPDNIALDDEKWNGEREEEHEEITHRKEMNRRRRQREIEEADTQNVEARRQKFTAEQGYENQQRLKGRNLRIWEKRREARELDAHAETERVRTELRGGEKPEAKPSNRDAMRAKVEESLLEAMADGNDAEVERWQRVLDALGE